MLTIEDFNNLPAGEVFAQGEVENSPEGVYMTDSNIGSQLMWVAKRGAADDWAIYIHWAYKGYNFVLSQGDKVTGPDNIKKLVPCTPEVLKKYRY